MASLACSMHGRICSTRLALLVLPPGIASTSRHGPVSPCPTSSTVTLPQPQSASRAVARAGSQPRTGISLHPPASTARFEREHARLQIPRAHPPGVLSLPGLSSPLPHPPNPSLSHLFPPQFGLIVLVAHAEFSAFSFCTLPAARATIASHLSHLLNPQSHSFPTN